MRRYVFPANCTLDESTDTRLDAAMTGTGKRKSEILREALTIWLERYEASNTPGERLVRCDQ